jgi:hypothetical protein
MDTQIGRLGEKYSLALDDGSAFNSYNLTLTNLLLYLTNVISHFFFHSLGLGHFFQSVCQTENVPREISIPVEEAASLSLFLI